MKWGGATFNKFHELMQTAYFTVDKKGNTVVQIPIELWNNILAEFGIPTQAERLRALLDEWEKRPPEEKPSDEWWDEFEQFLKENRLNFPERDLGLGEEPALR